MQHMRVYSFRYDIPVVRLDMTQDWTLIVQAAIAACQPGGRVVMVGMGEDDMKLSMTAASMAEIDIYGSFRYANTVHYICHCSPITCQRDCHACVRRLIGMCSRV